MIVVDREIAGQGGIRRVPLFSASQFSHAVASDCCDCLRLPFAIVDFHRLTSRRSGWRTSATDREQI